MDFSFIQDFFSNFQTDRIVETLANLKVGELIYEPWFIITMAVLALFCLICKLRLLFAFLVAVTGIAFLVSYTAEHGVKLDDMTNPTILVFIGGGVVVVGIILYLIFMRGD